MLPQNIFHGLTVFVYLTFISVASIIIGSAIRGMYLIIQNHCIIYDRYGHTDRNIYDIKSRPARGGVAWGKPKARGNLGPRFGMRAFL